MEHLIHPIKLFLLCIPSEEAIFCFFLWVGTELPHNMKYNPCGKDSFPNNNIKKIWYTVIKFLFKEIEFDSLKNISVLIRWCIQIKKLLTC